MQEETKTVSKPRQLWDKTVKAVKGGGTEELVETFTAEMTVVAEGLCEDQNTLRREIAQLRDMTEKLEHRANNEQELMDTTLKENQKDLDARLESLTHRIAALETKTARLDSAKSKAKERGWIGQVTILAAIIAGAWVLVTILNLFK